MRIAHVTALQWVLAGEGKRRNMKYSNGQTSAAPHYHNRPSAPFDTNKLGTHIKDATFMKHKMNLSRSISTEYPVTKKRVVECCGFWLASLSGLPGHITAHIIFQLRNLETPYHRGPLVGCFKIGGWSVRCDSQRRGHHGDCCRTAQRG